MRRLNLIRLIQSRDNYHSEFRIENSEKDTPRCDWITKSLTAEPGEIAGDTVAAEDLLNSEF
jgi:hypothetical protein